MYSFRLKSARFAVVGEMRVCFQCTNAIVVFLPSSIKWVIFEILFCCTIVVGLAIGSQFFV